MDQAAKEAFLREANRFPISRLPKEAERLKSEGDDRYGTLTREPLGPSDLGFFSPEGAVIAVGETSLFLFDSLVILGEGGITGLTYLIGGTENAYQHRYNPRSTVYKDLFSGKITTNEAILMVEINYGVTVLTLSPLARLGKVPIGGKGPAPKIGTGVVSLRGANNPKVRNSSKIGQEAHRQLELEGLGEWLPEKRIELPDGTILRKDGLGIENPNIVRIIKPDTPTGRSSAKKRADLLKENGYDVHIDFYDPTSPRFQPGSPTYIGPKK